MDFAVKARKQINKVRFWYKWDMMDIYLIPINMLIPGIVQQNKANRTK